MGCGLFLPKASFTIILPEPPEHWREAFGPFPFLLRYPDPGGGIAERLLDPFQIEVEVRVVKGNNLPATALPLIEGGRVFLPPAGGVFPQDAAAVDPPRLTLSWEQGPAAELLLRLAAEGLDLSTFNCPRLAAEMASRGAGDPWRLDLEHIGSRIAGGCFRVTDIRTLPCLDLELEPGPGVWFFESPFAAPQEVLEGGVLKRERVTLGFHRLFGTQTSYWYELYVEEKSLLWLRRE